MSHATTLPPRLNSGPSLPLLSGILMAGAILLIIPLSQIVGSFFTPDITPIDDVTILPPVFEEIIQPPKIEEKALEIKPVPTPVDAPMIHPDHFLPSVGGIAIPMTGIDIGNTLVEFPFEIDDLDEAPKLLTRPNIVYPPELRTTRQQGRVVVVMVVRADGTVGDVQVESSSHSLFTESVQRGLRQARYQPGMKDGKAVNTRVRQEFPFKLN